MNFIKQTFPGIFLALLISVPSWFLGKLLPVVGAPVFAIVIGMIITVFWKDKKIFTGGIKFTSKKILQWAVILLGFGLNLSVILHTGAQSLPIIICTISISLVIAFVLCKALKIDSNISVLVGVGSSICGGSAVAATAPVINADDEEVAQSISVIFFFNVLAALIFPAFGKLVGFDVTSGEAFGIFAGTAVNDTSSVTAAASTWDSMFNLGSQTLDKAVTVKLTRTLAIIPITLVLAFIQARKAKKIDAENSSASENQDENKNSSTSSFSFKKVFPFFILYFVAASVLTTLCYSFIKDENILHYVKTSFGFLKTLSKFFIVMAMAAIGLNTDIVKLVKTGGKPLLLGASCWIGITGISLLLQHFMGIW